MPRFNIPGYVYLNDNGKPLAGGKLNFYETGTTTRKYTYADKNQVVPNANPVVLDATGRAPNIFFSGEAKVVITDSGDVQVESIDPVIAMGSYNPELSDQVVTPAIYQLELSGYVPTLVWLNPIPAAGSLTLTGKAPKLFLAIAEMSAGSLTLTGYAPTITVA